MKVALDGGFASKETNIMLDRAKNYHPQSRDSTHLKFALPETGEDEIREVIESLKSGWITTGPKASRFEDDFAGFSKSKFAMAVNSATSGLHLALEAIGIGKEHKVITTPYTFTASAEVIRYLGADPVFVDIDENTYNIDPHLVEQALDKGQKNRIKAILPVHFGGQACDMDQITEIASRYGLKIIEDAAHALPCTYKGKKIGTIGYITVFSFYATKTMTTGEGGMVTTNDENIAKRIKIMRLHGINTDVWDRYTSNKPKWYYEVVEPGFKYNMPDILAAIGIAQLKKVNQFHKRREWIAKTYTESFCDLPLKTPYVARPDDTHAWHLYVITLELEKIRITRDEFIEKMAKQGIGTSVHFIPLHLHPYWRDRYRFKPDDFPKALDCFQRSVSLPIYSKMSDDDVDRVITAVKDILG